MHLLKTVFRQEWLQFKRQYWMPVSLLVFIAIAVLSLLSGRQAVQTRLVQIDSIQKGYRQDLQIAIGRFADTSTPQAKAVAKSAGMPAVINYRLPQTVIKQPSSLAVLSIGLMDVMPWYQQVRYVKNYNDDTIVPVSNPMVLFSGNFDYTFVLIYLLPLMIIGWCYSVFDSEKKAGTLSLLTIQTGKLQKIIRLKLLFRFGILLLAVIVLNLVGFAICSSLYKTSWVTYGWWMLLSVLYLAFWFAVCRLFVAFTFTAAATALSQVSCWLFMLIVVPSLANAYVEAIYPLPLKDEISAYRRHQSEEIWNTSAKILSDSFNLYNPQYASTIDPARDSVKLSARYVAGYYDLLERRMNRILAPYNEELNTRNEFTQKLLSWNPVVMVQNNFSRLADNNLIAYKTYTAQSDTFQKNWQAYLYPYHFSNKNLAPANFKEFPIFNYQPANLSYKNLFTDVVLIIAITVLLLFAAGRVDIRTSN
jgi:ABC-2 type transport system permease protein